MRRRVNASDDDAMQTVLDANEIGISTDLFVSIGALRYRQTTDMLALLYAGNLEA